MNSCAVYSDNINDTSLIDILYKYFKQQYKDCDFNIFSSNEQIFNSLNIASLSTFYMRFFKGKIIFCNIEDYLEYKDNILNECYLVATIEDCTKFNINSKPNGIKFLKIDGDNVYEI